ncbi:MAG: tetratricopeptide repeat protein [Flavobacteriaceae bacterium]|nr:tetratricopeptide repeat protein [Flavobacteriaceae bacterium]
MKTRFIFVLTLFFGCISYAQTTNELFSKANNFYKNGEYSKAIQLYLNIEKSGLESDDLFFNLGNSYYKLDKVAPSIYYYEKAIKLNPMHIDASNNLVFAKRMTIDVVEDLPKTFLQRFSTNVVQKLTYDTWAILAVTASFLAAFLFLMYYFSTSPKKKIFYFNTTIFAVFLMIFTVIFAFSNYETTQKSRSAIIFSSKTDVKNSPSLDGETVFELHEGTKVTILDALSNWKKIKIADGKIGWVNATDIKEI